MNNSFKKGDFVGFIFAMPGPDITQAVVVEVGDKVRCYDPWFDLEFNADPAGLWHLSEKELVASVDHFKFGVVSVKEKLLEVRNKLNA